MKIYLIKGNITSKKINSFSHLKIQGLDNDQKWNEDHNDDLLGATWVNHDGSFEISFSKTAFRDNFLEGKPEIYLIIRNKDGQIIHKTDHIEIQEDDGNKDQPIQIDVSINIDSLKHKLEEPALDPYKDNNDRIRSAFSSLGDVSTLNIDDFKRNLRLVNNSINGWLFYAQEYSWDKIGYDGPQVPRYPRKNDHEHVLSWEQEK